MSILISDFDGTLTRYDFFDLVRKRWPFLPEDDPWEKFVDGRITHFEALAEIFARIRTSEADLLELANSMELDSGFAKAARELQERRWEIVIASAGCDWYIRFLLDQAGVSVLLYANLEFSTPNAACKCPFPSVRVFSAPRRE
jgi:2-hydroxy-3-keto-5-methylthiopentenyl-1-phosphate phosphatase